MYKIADLFEIANMDIETYKIGPKILFLETEIRF